MYDRIRDKVSELTSILKDMNTFSPNMHSEGNFEHLYTTLEKRMKESSATGMAGKQNQASSQEGGVSSSQGGVSASDNCVSTWNISIGGNFDGNLVIGNNNQVDKK